MRAISSVRSSNKRLVHDLASHISCSALPELFHSPETTRCIWLATLALGGAPLVWRTLRGLARGDFALDLIATLAIVTALVMDQYFAGVVIVLMQTGGEALERDSLGRASSALNALIRRAPHTAHRRAGEGFSEIPASQVRVGDELLVRPGDLVPADGVLISEAAEVDESSLTGEPLARLKHAGDGLMSGSANAGGAFRMRASREAAESQYARIITLVQQAEEDRPPMVRMADRYAAWFTPLTLAMCAFGWALTRDVRTILAVLVVATPCPLLLAVPVAVIGAVNRAARANIIVKGGTALEQIADAEAFLFDKTGTLTVGRPVLDEVVTFGAMSRAELLRIAGSAESQSSHPVAQAVVAAASEAGPLPTPAACVEVPGRGAVATLDGQTVLVGSKQLMVERTGAAGPPDPETPGALVAYVAVAGEPVGLLRLADRLRSGVEGMVADLRAAGIRHIALLTGDNALNARAVGEAIHADEVFGDLLPEEKTQTVREAVSRYGSAVMVGDGVNDAPALATATVGVAMGAHGTGVSAQAADIVLLEDDVTRVVEAVAIGRRMVRIARQSVFAGLGLSLGLMTMAAFGLIPPVTGALLQEGIDVAVILNALRARGSGARRPAWPRQR
jgi:heavy metal translocating P-type ATPase